MSVVLVITVVFIISVSIKLKRLLLTKIIEFRISTLEKVMLTAFPSGLSAKNKVVDG